MVVGGAGGRNKGVWLEGTIREFETDSENLVNSINSQLIGRINNLEKIQHLVDSISMLGQIQNESLVKCSIFSQDTYELRNCSDSIISIGDSRIKQITDLLSKHI